MKKTILIVAAALVLILAGGLAGIYLWNGSSIKQNITIAQDKYPGTSEEALISYLMDENNAATNRTHLAIWTLGQIRSEKALPVLNSYYHEDPEGNSCYGKHESMLCQYELHKAIQSIEKKYVFTHAGLK